MLRLLVTGLESLSGGGKEGNRPDGSLFGMRLIFLISLKWEKSCSVDLEELSSRRTGISTAMTTIQRSHSIGTILCDTRRRNALSICKYMENSNGVKSQLCRGKESAIIPDS